MQVATKVSDTSSQLNWLNGEIGTQQDGAFWMPSLCGTDPSQQKNGLATRRSGTS
jgi:hypothetical protein